MMAAGKPPCQPRPRLPTRHGPTLCHHAYARLMAPLLLFSCLFSASSAASSPQLGPAVHAGLAHTLHESGFAAQRSKQPTNWGAAVQRGDSWISTSSRRLLLAADVQPPQQAGQQALDT